MDNKYCAICLNSVDMNNYATISENKDAYKYHVTCLNKQLMTNNNNNTTKYYVFDHDECVNIMTIENNNNNDITIDIGHNKNAEKCVGNNTILKSMVCIFVILFFVIIAPFVLHNNLLATTI